MRKFYLANLKSFRFFIFFLSLFFSLVTGYNAFGQSLTYATPGTYTFTVPAGVTSITVSTWGGGGAGGGVNGNGTGRAGGGGEGGSFVRGTISVVPGATYTVVVGNGGAGVIAANGIAGQASSFSVPAGATLFNAIGGGAGAVGANLGAGGNLANTGNVVSGTVTSNFYGGNGGTATTASTASSGGGGGSAGAGGNGGNGGTPLTAGTAGAGTPSDPGVAGAVGRGSMNDGNGNNGNPPGAGGSGARNANDNTDFDGGDGGNGQVIVNLTCPTYSITGVSAPAICQGSTATVTLAGSAAGLPVGTYTVTYNTGAPNAATGLTATMTVTTAGTGSFTTPTVANSGSTAITITKLASGSTPCSSTISTGNTTSLTVSPKPTVTNSPLTQTICSGGNTTLVSLTSGVAGTTFSWTATATAGVSGFTTSGTGTIPVQAISTTGTTQGTVTYAITPTAAGCTGAVTNYTVLVNPKPVVSNATLTQTVCSGGSTTLVTLTSNIAGATFAWTATATAGVSGFTTSGTGTIPVQTISTTGTTQGTVTYAITPTAAGCPGAVTNYTVLVNPKPTVTNTPLTQTICSGGSTSLVTLTSGVAGATFAWTATATAGVSGFTTSGTGTIPVQTISTTGTTQGTVTYAITPTATGCPGAVTNYTVLVNPKPTVTNTPLTQTICSGLNTTLVTLTSGIAGTTFAWTATSTAGVSGFTTSGTGTIPVQTISTTAITQGTVTYAITPTAAGCPGAVTNYTVLVNPAPIVSAGSALAAVCQGGTTPALGGSFGGGATAAVWSDGGAGGTFANNAGTTPNTTTYTAGAASGTPVTLTLTTSGGLCGINSDFKTLIVNPNPTVNVGGALAAICQGNTTPALGGSFGGGATSAIWSDGGAGGTFANNGGSTPGTATYTASASAPATVTLTLTTSGGSCGPISDTKDITVYQSVNITTDPGPATQTICAASNVSYTVVATGSGLTYKWYKDGTLINNGGRISGAITSTLTITGATLADDGDYTVVVSGLSPCTSATSAIAHLDVDQKILFTTQPVTPQTICEAQPYTISVFATGTIGLYQWYKNGSLFGTGTFDGANTYTLTIPAVTVADNGSTWRLLLDDGTGVGCSSANSNIATLIVRPTPTATISGTTTVCQNSTSPLVTFTNPQSLPVVVTYDINGAGTSTINIAANSTATIAAPTGVAGTFDYNDVSVAYQTGPGCSNPITGTATITVNPIPNAIATPASQQACSADPITTIVLSSAVTGTTYAWTRTNTGTVTGIAASGSGDISGTLTNTTNAPIIVTFTITPTAATCVGTAITATVTVNPKPIVTPKTSTICGDGSFTVTPTNGAGNIVPTGTTYSWSAPSVTGGLTGGTAVSGASAITGTLSNPTNTVQTATYTVTPLSGSCTGADFTVTITVNPKPVVTPQTASTCSATGFTVTPTNGGGNIVPTGTTYTWAAPSVTGGLLGGAVGSNAATISGTLTNPTNTAQTATYTVTPLTGSCPGSTFTVTITVNPKPLVSTKTATVCNANAFSVVPVNAPATNIVPAGTTYSWSAPSVTGSMTGGVAATGSADISGTLVNPTNANQTATYTVTPLSGSCTGSTFTVVVTVTPEPFVLPKTAAACSGVGFTVTPTNGGGNIVPTGTTYTWSAPSVTGGLTGGAAGTNAANISGTLTNPTSSVQTATYTVTPKSGTCTGADFTVTVTVNPKPFVTPQTTSTCSASGFTVTPTDGGGNIVPTVTTYSWSAPSVTGSMTGGTGGTNAASITGTLTNPTNTNQTATYTVTPSSGGCAGLSFTVTVTVNPKPFITAKTATVCNEDIFTVSPVNNNPTGNLVPAGTTYSWSAPSVTGGMTGGASGTNATSITGALTNPTNVNQAATYTVTPLSGSCTGATFTVTVTVTPEPFVTAKTATICSAGGFTVLPTNGAGSIVPGSTTYSWPAPSVTGGVTGGAAGTNAANISGTLTNPTTAVQTATYTVTPKSGSCTGLPFTVTVTVNPKPTAGAITGPATVCIGSTINLASNATGIGTLTYTWSSSNGARATVNASGVVTGVSVGTTNITYTVTDGNGCVQTSANFLVTITKPTANAITQASGLDEVCVNSTLPLTANATGVGTLTYTWASSNTARATVSSTGVVTGVSAGTVNITYTVTDGNGCSTTSAAFPITVDAIPTGSIVITENSGNANNDNIICAGASVTFTAPTPNGSYIFKVNGISVQTGTNNVFSTTALASGDIVTVDVANALNCGATLTAAPVVVNPLPTPVFGADKTSICPGDPVTFTAGGGTNYTFKVNGVAQQSGASTTFTSTTLTNGNSVTVDVKNANGCIATPAAIVITVNTLPTGTLSASNTSICTGDNVTFTFTDPTTYANYNFKVNGTSVQSGTSNIFNTTTLTNGAFVTIDVTNASNCLKTFGPIAINVSNLPVGTLTGTENSGTPNDFTICAGSPVSFLATAGYASYDFQVNGVSKQNSASNTFNTTLLANGDVITVVVKNSATCATTFGTITMIVNPIPAGTLSVAPSNTICVGDNVTFTATAGFDNYEFKINGATAQNGSGNTFSSTALANGNIVSVEVTNNGCAATFNTITMVVNALPSGTLAIAETSGNTANDGFICTGATVLFTAPGGFTNYNFLVNGGSVQNGTSPTFSTTALVNGDQVTVAVGNASGCIGLLNTWNITVYTYPVVAPITGTLSVCVNGTTALASTTPGGVWSSLNTAIATVNSTGVVTGVSAGNATINYTVTNANGCVTIASATVTVNPLPVVAAISGANAVCVTGTTPFTDATTGGVWTSDDPTIATVNSTGVVTGVAAGTATIRYSVTSASNCVTAVIKTITVNALPVVAAITGSTSVCFNSTTNLADATPAGIWSSDNNAVATVSTTGVVTGVSAGSANISYSVTTSGCTTTVTTAVTVNALPVPTLTGPSPICLGSIGNVYTTESGQSNYVWNVVNGTVSTGGGSGDNSVTVSWLSPGAKSINVNYTDANGCVGATSATVANAPGSSPTITGPAIVCQNDAGNIYTTETGKVDYTWTISGGTITSGGGLTDDNVTVTWTTTGTRSVTVNYSDVGGCDAATPTVKNITVNPQPTVVITNPAAVCSPATVDLTAAAIKAGSTAGLTYTYWQDAGATIAYTTPATAGAGTYYIKGTTGAACIDIKPVTVTVNPSPTVVITTPAAICAPGTIDLTDPSITAGSTAGLTYTYWTNAAATTAYGTPTTAGAGTYYIKGAVGSGCFDIQPITITVNPLPTVVTNNPASVCSPATVDLTAPAVTAGSTAGLTFTYWTDAAATVSYPTPATAGGGVYYIKGQTAAGCADIKPVTVTANATPAVVTHAPAAACSPGTADLTAPAVTAGSSPGLTYTYWTNAAATASYATPATAAAGTYYIKGTAAGGCFDIKSVLVTVNPSPTVVTNNPAAVCAPATVNLTTAAVTTGSTAGLTFSYWTNAAATTAYATPTTAGAGTYYIKGTVTATGCYDIKPVTVTVNPLPTLVITNPAAVCTPATVNITLPAVTAGSTAGLTLTYWTNAAATTAFTTPTTAGAGTYYIKGTTAAGCSDIKPVVVTVNAPPPAFVVTPGNTAICLGNTQSLSASLGAPTAGSKSASGNIFQCCR